MGENVKLSFVDSSDGTSLLAQVQAGAFGGFGAVITIPNTGTPGAQHIKANGLRSPITVDKDGPKGWKLNKEAAVTVTIYRIKGQAVHQNFAFRDTKAAAEKAKDVAASIEEALK